jgi:hypothetical protein
MIDNRHIPDDIRKLRQDLENLERCYAALEQGARRAKAAFVVCMAALTVVGVFLDNGLLLSALSCAALILSATLAVVESIRGVYPRNTLDRSRRLVGVGCQEDRGTGC